MQSIPNYYYDQSTKFAIVMPHGKYNWKPSCKENLPRHSRKLKVDGAWQEITRYYTKRRLIVEKAKGATSAYMPSKVRSK